MILKISDRFKNRQISFFRDVQIDLKYDAFASAFQLSYYFDPDNIEHKEFSCVSHYHICQLFYDNGDLILTGYILSIEFDDKAVKSLVRISGYSLPGVLEDCDIAPTIPEKFSRTQSLAPYSLQTYGLSLREIAQNLIQPFGIKLIVDSSVSTEMNEPYDETEAKETQSIKSYLSELASQKNIIITHNQYGNLVFTRPRNTKPRFEINPDVREAIGITRMRMAFNGQGVHSQITVVSQSDAYESNIGEQQTLFNPYCTTIFRPKVLKVTQRSGKVVDTERAARNARSQELMNLSLDIEMDRFTIDNKIVRVGDVISVQNPNTYLYNKSNWFVKSISYKKDPEQETSIIKCCLPEAISGDDPVYIFRGINLHPIDV